MVHVFKELQCAHMAILQDYGSGFLTFGVSVLACVNVAVVLNSKWTCNSCNKDMASAIGLSSSNWQRIVSWRLLDGLNARLRLLEQWGLWLEP
jgi:hypothetical protein